MKTQFDKIYVISLTTNKLRQEHIKYQFNQLELDYEFIYGPDFYNIENDYKGDKIKWPETYINDQLIPGSFGCSLGHYQGILQAYEFGYNNVLIVEDDICFIKDIKLLEHYLNNIPEDADFITYDPRFLTNKELNSARNIIKKSKFDWSVLPNEFNNLIGGMMYGLINRNTMKLYLENQRKLFNISDSVQGIFRNPIKNIKRYIASKCICTDQYNIYCNFNSDNIFYHNIYNDNINIENFYNPSMLSIFTRYSYT